MRKLVLLSFLVVSVGAAAQVPERPLTDTLVTDSSTMVDLKEDLLESIPEVTTEEADNEQGSVSPILLSTRDPFFSASTFTFSTGRVRFRGYPNNFNSTYMNGLTMETLENGSTPYSQWNGLNYVLRNRKMSIGLAPTSFGYGNIGTAVNIDLRASKQFRGTRMGYTFSTGTVTNRFSFSHSTGLGKKGWAFTIGGSFSGADEGYVPGTYTNSFSYFGGIDKKIGRKHLLSLVGFAAHTESGAAGSTVGEMQDLAGSHYYNPNWGYQNGKKRNAVVYKGNQPVFILTHEFKIDTFSNIVTAIGYTFGERSRSTLDWYNAADPRPDYYRYLPSYQEDPAIEEQVREHMMSDESTRQINWDKLYYANRTNFTTVHNANGIAGNDVSGYRSNYVVADWVTKTRRGSFRTVYNQRVNKYIDFSAGFSTQIEINNYYQRLQDLLGGQFFVNINQFAERDYPSNPNAGQVDVNHPNQILKVGDKYGYDYEIHIDKTAAWSQGVIKYKKLDVFGAAEISNTHFYRVGNYRNGLFPDNSYGRSQEYNFNNYSVKAGLGYRFSRHHYIYVNAVQLTRAPFYRNIYISPRTRDFVQSPIKNERIQSIEGGYVMTAPFVKMRISGYYTEMKNHFEVTTFYHDVYRSFVSYSMRNIGRVDYGGEIGLESRAIRNIILSGSAAVGRHYYNGRPIVTVTSDNTAAILSQDVIYSNNYRLNTPQEAYTFGVQYRSPKFWNIGANVNYFDQSWLSFNPTRRTTNIVEGVPYKSDEWNTIVDQVRLPGETTVDASAGYSWKLPARMLHRKAFFYLGVNVRNVLDNQNFITGGYEQLRFDAGKLDKFPPKLYYAYGRTYTVSATLRF